MGRIGVFGTPGLPNPSVKGTLTDRDKGWDDGSRPRVKRVYDCWRKDAGGGAAGARRGRFARMYLCRVCMYSAPPRRSGGGAEKKLIIVARE